MVVLNGCPVWRILCHGIYCAVIHSFACSDTEALFHSQIVRRFRNIERVARRKLLQLHAATGLASLRVPLERRQPGPA